MLYFDSYAQLADYINEKFDPTVINFIFGDSNGHIPEGNDAQDFLDNFGKIYQFTQITYLLIYLKWMNIGKQLDYSIAGKHAKKVFSVLSRLYKDIKYSTGILSFILSEAKKDVIELRYGSFFSDIFNEEEYDFYSYYNLVENFLTDNINKELFTDEFNLELYSEILANTNFYQDLTIGKSGKSGPYFLLNGEKLFLYDICFKDEKGFLYILQEREFSPLAKKNVCLYLEMQTGKEFATLN